MNGILADLRDREYSISRLLDHINELSESRGKVEVIVVLKSSAFIAMYNNIEATVYSCAEKIHSYAAPLSYNALSRALQIKMIKYSFGKGATALMQDQDKISQEEAALRDSGRKFPELDDYLRRQTLVSGNVDARQLNVVSISYGLPKNFYPKSDAEKMLWIKNKRNKIAHGEQSMVDAGKGIKTEELCRAAESTSIILRTFVKSIDSAIKAGHLLSL